MRPLRRFPSYGKVSAANVADAISAVGSLTATTTSTVGGLDAIRTKQAAQGRLGTMSAEVASLSEKRAAAEQRVQQAAAGAGSGGLPTYLPNLLGGLMVLALVGVGVYAVRSRRT
jgi:cobalamin biosynthesis Mg chelatase CobN